MHVDMFRLRLQSSSGPLVVQIRYNHCAYDMGPHIVRAIIVPDLYYK